MKEEKMLDALSFLDDDMIEAVDKRRRQSRQIRRYSARFLALAASICIVFAGLYLAQASGFFPFISNDKENESSPPQNNFPIKEEASNSFDENTEEVPKHESDIVIQEVPSVLVAITAWSAEGFEGIVSGILDTEIFKIGESVTIVFEEDISVEVLLEDETYQEIEKIPDKKDFPVGTVVKIRFRDYEVKNGRKVLYAESVIPENAI